MTDIYCEFCDEYTEHSEVVCETHGIESQCDECGGYIDCQ